jgi:pimeloyl-ACP methyl ester carboxylesterase
MGATRRLLFFSFLLSLLVFVQPATAQDFTGTWQGRLRFMKFDLRLVLKLQKDSSDRWSGTLQSPEQSKVAYPVEELTVRGDTLSFEVSEMETAYQGVFSADSNAFLGRFSQRGFKLPMKLIKGDDIDLLYHRPQRPRPPFPYTVEEVRIVNKEGGDTLAGTLTRPSGKGRHPSVVLITGSGPEDRDETVFAHKPFLLIADRLTRLGFAVLRCDDRGAGASTGVFATATPDDFASDVRAQVAYLRKRKDIDRKKVGLLGHSEGGIIAPMVAASDDKIAFVILMAAPAIDLFDLLLAQDSIAAKSEGAKRKDIDETITTNTRLFEIVKSSNDSAEAARQMVDYLDSAGASDREIEASLRQLGTPWMRWYIGFDPAINLSKTKCPVLAMNGQKDVQVPAELNLPVIDSLLKASGNIRYSTVSFPGVNHLFQPCRKCNVSEYVDIDVTMEEEVLQRMGEWLSAQTRDRRD